MRWGCGFGEKGKKWGKAIGMIPVIGSLGIAIGYSVVVGWLFKVSKQRGYRKPDEDRRYGGLFWRAGGRLWKRRMADAGPGAYLPGHGLRSNERDREDEQGYDARILLVLHHPSDSRGNFAGSGGRLPLYVRTPNGSSWGISRPGYMPWDRPSSPCRWQDPARLYMEVT